MDQDGEEESKSNSESEKDSEEEESESELDVGLGTGDTTKILVTGGNGYLGSHIVKQLLEKGVSVRVSVSNLNEKARYYHLLSLDGADRLEIVEAKLTDRNCWNKVVNGCAAIVHTASPTPHKAPKQELDVIFPAVEGTLALLKAAEELGVRRVVMTSCFTAVKGGKYKFSYTEDNWGEPENISSVEKSKIFAERAAWFFQKQNPKKIELTTICPGYLLGPCLQNHCEFSSGLFFKKWTSGQVSSILKYQIPLCDVRNAAAVHVQALWNPTSVKQRYLCVQDTHWFEDLNAVLKKNFVAENFEFPEKVISSLSVKFIAFFDSMVATMIPFYSKEIEFSSEKLMRDFTFEFRDVSQTLVDMGLCFIEKGFYQDGPCIKVNETAQDDSVFPEPNIRLDEDQQPQAE